MSTATRWVLIVLTAEKIVQHAVVSWALIFDRFALRPTVAVDYRWLAVAGVVAGVLFAMTLVGLVRGHRWSLVVLAILATADVVGEFVAQGTLMITITLSFVVGLIILVLSLRASRRVKPGGQRRLAHRLRDVPAKSTSLVSTVPAVRPGAVW